MDENEVWTELEETRASDPKFYLDRDHLSTALGSP
jgi:hypothetical protein